MNNLYKYSLVPICILFICTIPLLADEAKFAASSQSSEYTIGSKITVTYTLTKGGGSSFKPATHKYLKLIGYSQIPKNSTKKISATAQAWSVDYIAQSAGNIVLPPALVFAGGKAIASNSLKLNITKSKSKPTVDFNQPKNIDDINKLLFIKLSINKTVIYENETVTATYSLYFAAGLNIDSVLDLKAPNFDRFLAFDVNLEDTIAHPIIIEGRNYFVQTIKQTTLIPLKYGKFNIEPLEITYRLNPGSVYPYYGKNAVDFTVRTNTCRLQALPLPTPKPGGFCGGVGSFSLSSSLSRYSAARGEAVYLELELSGKGSFPLITAPQLFFPKGIEVDEPKETDIYTFDGSDFVGIKRFTYRLTAMEDGEFNLPVEIIVFNDSLRKYELLQANALTLAIGDKFALAQDAIESDEDLFGNSPFAQVSPLIERLESFMPYLIAFAILILISLIIAIVLLIRKMSHSSKNNISSPEVNLYLDELEALLRHNDINTYAERSYQIILDYYKAKYRRAADFSSKQELLEEMRLNSEPEQIQSAARKALEEIEKIRFSSAQTDINIYELHNILKYIIKL
jgi:hypothetical protein